MRRLSAFLAVIGLLAMLASAGPVAASNRPIEYLALGDSLAFGYNPLIVPPTDPSAFVGYPDGVAAALRDGLTNASCPGETSSHFIDLTGSDNGCGPFRAYFPLHVDYNTTQLAFTDAFLRAHPKTLAVGIDLGANDLHVLINGCPGGQANVPCVLAGLPEMLATLSANLDTIYGHIRVADGYHHKLVALTYPSLNYADPVETQVVAAVNQVVAGRTLAWGGIVADGFGAWYAASIAYGGDTCAAGLRIVKPDLTCDDHPSVLGHALLAQAIMAALRPD